MRFGQQFSSNYKRLWSLALLALLLCIPFFMISRLSLLREIEARSQDLRFKLSPHPQMADSSIVLVAIDQGSLKYAAQLKHGWPFPRIFYAVLTEYLTDQKAKAVVFDILFDEPDFFRGEEDPGFSDDEFAAALSNCPNAILAFAEGAGNAEVALQGHELNLSASVPALSLIGVQAPIGKFSQAATRLGGVSLSGYSDSILRSLPAFYRYEGKLYPNLGVAACMRKDGSLPGFQMNSKGEISLLWYGKAGVEGVFKYLPFSAVLYSAAQSRSGGKSLFPKDYFSGKTVLIGATAAGLMDLKSSPYTWGMPGMEAWATLISNLSQGHSLNVPSLPVQFLLIYLVILLVFIMVVKSNAGYGPILGFLILGLILISAWYCFKVHFIMLDTVSLVLSWVLAWLFILSLGYWSEGKHKRELRLVFSRYLHPDLVDRITANPALVQMGGEELNATVLFTDIYDFTKFSEKHQPPELVKFLNEYFSSFTNTILDNHGMLDKYTGDGLMAVFGAPLAREDHALCACKAALAHRKMSLQLASKEQLSPSDCFHLGTRIGINSGFLVAGNIGSQRRMEYTCIGDPVNLASRLEGVNKFFGTHIIISESTLKFVETLFITRELDYLKVKGKDTPTRIYELLDDADSSTDYSWTKQYAQGLQHYREGSFQKAAESFEYLCRDPDPDKPSKAMRERCLYLIQHPPETWEGIWTLDSK